MTNQKSNVTEGPDVLPVRTHFNDLHISSYFLVKFIITQPKILSNIYVFKNITSSHIKVNWERCKISADWVWEIKGAVRTSWSFFLAIARTKITWNHLETRKTRESNFLSYSINMAVLKYPNNEYKYTALLYTTSLRSVFCLFVCLLAFRSIVYTIKTVG